MPESKEVLERKRGQEDERKKERKKERKEGRKEGKGREANNAPTMKEVCQKDTGAK